MNFYNDNDPGACHWLRSLIDAELIPTGVVEPRSLTDLGSDDLDGYQQVHLFAGIGGWPAALALAGVPRDAPVWTASCPCQPFSVAGKGAGTADKRHLWPYVGRLVEECRPPVLFGEQVASPAGREWFARVRDDLEAMGYRVGASGLPACSVGAPHRRERMFFGAVSDGESLRWWPSGAADTQPGGRQLASRRADARVPRGAPDADGERLRSGGRGEAAQALREPEGEGRQRQRVRPDAGPALAGELRGLGDVRGAGPQVGSLVTGVHCRADESVEGRAALVPGVVGDWWSDFIVVACNDGRLRRAPAEPAIFPLADGLPGRVAQLRGLGNAIVPQVAAEFVMAFLNAASAAE